MKVKELVIIVAIIAIVFVGYDKHKSHIAESDQLQAMPARQTTQVSPEMKGHSWISPHEAESMTSNTSSKQFKCDGRTYCSQMTSCAEALYFLQHCPNIKMDGDYNGEPCERQWCNQPQYGKIIN